MDAELPRMEGQTFESAHAEWWAGLRGFARTRKKSTDKARSAWIKHAGREPQRQDSLPQ